MANQEGHLNQPVSVVMRRDVATLREKLTINQALDSIRQQGVGEKIVYFYVINEERRLVGVMPTRRLLTAPLDRQLAEVMIDRVIAVPQTATVLEACEAFIMHRYLAFPVVDEQRRIVGVLDADLLTDEAFDIAEREQTDAFFESIGFRLSQVRDASPLRAFRFRFPWLVATISSGVICALLVSIYQFTLAKSLILAFFLTLVLGLGESVSIQSMTVAIQALRSIDPSLRWYLRSLRRELGTAMLLGFACGSAVGLIVWFWQGAGVTALSIGSGIGLS
ncbi:MAG: magnesium transporter, partial [Calditrichaeota bacterium]